MKAFSWVLPHITMFLMAMAVLTALVVRPTDAFAQSSQRYTISAQALSLAPNAGGQQAYSLALATNSWEAGAFSNQYITAGNKPLTGATFNVRFPICDDACWWQFFVQAGGGISNGGPLTEITWGTVIPLLPIWLPTQAPRFVPALRLDITSQQIYILPLRAVTWSYPLWAGVAVAF
jgi:hypothetical protein